MRTILLLLIPDILAAAPPWGHHWEYGPELQCVDHLPEEPCFHAKSKHACYPKQAKASWPHRKQEICQPIVDKVADAQTEDRYLELNIDASSTSDVAQSLPIHPPPIITYGGEPHVWDPTCCRITNACFTYMKAHKGIDFDNPDDKLFNTTFCRLGLLAQSCQFIGGSTIEFPSYIVPAPGCVKIANIRDNYKDLLEVYPYPTDKWPRRPSLPTPGRDVPIRGKEKWPKQ